MKIKVIAQGETEFTPDAGYAEPAIRAAIAAGTRVELAIMDYTDGQRDTGTDEYIIITEDDGTVLWSGWLSGHLKDKAAPGAVELERDEANADRRELAHLNHSQACLIRELKASLSSLTDRAEAGYVLTGDEADEFRQLAATAVPVPDAAGDDPVERLLALPLPENDLGASTVREALSKALSVAWDSGGNWSPTGNSDWQHILYRAMTEAGMARIGYGEDGYATEPETAPGYAEANAAITAAIERLGAS